MPQTSVTGFCICCSNVLRHSRAGGVLEMYTKVGVYPEIVQRACECRLDLFGYGPKQIGMPAYEDVVTGVSNCLQVVNIVASGS